MAISLFHGAEKQKVAVWCGERDYTINSTVISGGFDTINSIVISGGFDTVNSIVISGGSDTINSIMISGGFDTER